MIFELVHDFADALAAMPRKHPHYRILTLLDEAIRRDVHFIDRHPTTFFQCMWNTCWWYDCTEAASYCEARSAPGKDRGVPLHRPLEEWRKEKGKLTPGFVWPRSGRRNRPLCHASIDGAAFTAPPALLPRATATRCVRPAGA